MEAEYSSGVSPELPIPEVPHVYELIAAEAPSPVIAQQICEDFYTTHDMERVLLGLESLLERDLEGKATLDFLARSSDRLGDIARHLSSQPHASQDAIEKMLGIERWGPVYEASESETQEFFRTLYDRAIERGYTKASFEECASTANQLFRTNVHMRGTLQDSLFNVAATFGVDEPTYIELIGPRIVK